MKTKNKIQLLNLTGGFLRLHCLKSQLFRLLGFFVCLLCVMPAFSKPVSGTSVSDKENADSLYAKGEYRAAVSEYSRLTSTVRSADIYYNLGNCYYRLNEYAQARYAYELARMLAPTDKDIKQNLKFAESKIKTDEAKSQSILSVWFGGLCYNMSVAGWLTTAFIAFAAMLAAFLAFVFGASVRIRKVAFFVCIVCFVATAVSFACGGIQTYNFRHPSQAIVLKTADVYRSPSRNAGIVKQIAAGSKINLLDDRATDGWYRVSYGGSGSGWIPLASLGIIGFDN